MVSAVQHRRPPALMPTGVVGTRSRAGAPTRARSHPVAQAALVLGFYALASALYIGRRALADPTSGTIGTGPDVQIFLWGLRWWPYALSHGLNPMLSQVVWAPHGVDVLWTTTVPLLSLLVAPLTLTLGPTLAWNVLCVLAPAFAAWSAFLLCRELTRALWPSVAGGALFGFSSYQLAEGLAHLHVAATLLVPLAALIVVRHARGRMSGRGFAVRVAMVTAAQFLIAPELLATLVLMSVLAATLALALMPEQRSTVRAALRWGAAGLAGAAVVVAPVLAFMLRDVPSGAINPASTYSDDLLNLVVPTRITWLGGSWAAPLSHHFGGNLAEQTAYLGLPLLLVVAAFAYTNWADPAVRLLSLLLAAAVTLSLGPDLRIGGHALLWLPGSLVFHLPVLEDALPARFALYSSLICAAMVALWLARPWPTSRWRWAAVGLCLLSLAPSTAGNLWWQRTPPAVAHNDLARVIPPGATVISLPFWRVDDRALYAQAVADMRFRLIDRWLQVVPSSETGVAEAPLLEARRVTAAEVPAFERDLCALGAQYAIVWNDAPGRAAYLAALHVTPLRIDHLLVYRLPIRDCARTVAVSARPRRSGTLVAGHLTPRRRAASPPAGDRRPPRADA